MTTEEHSSTHSNLYNYPDIQESNELQLCMMAINKSSLQFCKIDTGHCCCFSPGNHASIPGDRISDNVHKYYEST